MVLAKPTGSSRAEKAPNNRACSELYVGCDGGLGQSSDHPPYEGLREEQVWAGAGTCFGHVKSGVHASKQGAWVPGRHRQTAGASS